MESMITPDAALKIAQQIRAEVPDAVSYALDVIEFCIKTRRFHRSTNEGNRKEGWLIACFSPGKQFTDETLLEVQRICNDAGWEFRVCWACQDGLTIYIKSPEYNANTITYTTSDKLH